MRPTRFNKDALLTQPRWRSAAATRKTNRTWIAIVALASISSGTLLAVGSVPIDLHDPSALFKSTLFMTFSLLLPIAVQLRVNLRDTLRVENFVMLGLVYWLLVDMLQSAYSFESVAKSDVQMAFVAVGVFAGSVWLGVSGKGWKPPNAVSRSSFYVLSDRALLAALLIAFFLGISKFALATGFNPVLMIEGIGMPRWASPWSRGQFGGVTSITDHLQYFGYLLPSLTVLFAVRKGWLSGQSLIGLILSAIVLAFLAQGGGRRIIGATIGAALLTWLLTKPVLRPKVVFYVVSGVLSLLFAMQEMLRFRNIGFGAWWRGERPELNVDYLHIDDNFLRLSQIISFFPERVDYIYHKPIFHALTLPVPRFLWAEKPIGPGFDLPGLLGMQGVSLSTSILGELWVSFGMVGIVMGGYIFGKISGMWNKVLQPSYKSTAPMLYALGVMVVFVGLRSMQAMVQMSYVVVAWVVVSSYLQRSGPRYPRPAL